MNLKEAQNRQRSYVANRRKDLEFQVDDRVCLKMAMLQGGTGCMRRCYACISQGFHCVYAEKVFHKDDELLAKTPANLQSNMTMEARPMRVPERRIKEIQQKKISLMRVLRDCDGVEEQTLDPEVKMNTRFKKWFEKQAEA
ncbi:PREDICTED: uncharacterized protein LOC109129133 [Camelina sativa]|uniref:Uncharacterized protein LOC109129133 n=1 Tax=Camelina sativa TaxID=90675 RepID=A0ABM1QZY1_CAMSA|nr:PREDICTED: uncharacterized protein LOC109129133 [Camelina sativa]